MKEEGIENFFKAMGVDVSVEMIFWLVSMQMKAESYGEYQFSEFLTGCQVNKCDTIEKWSQVVPQLRNEIKKEDTYFEVYKFAGRFACEKGKKNLEIDWALSLQELFLGKRCKFMDPWAKLLRAKRDSGKLLVLPRDTWDQFYVLVRDTKGDIKNFVDDGSWPSLFDEFVASM